MMIESAPTYPTPWRLEWDYQQLRLLAANGEEISEWTFAIPTYEPRYAEMKATCDTEAPDLIVRAVNAHSDLIEAVQFLMNCVEMEPDDATWREAMESARNALALAKFGEAS